MKNTGFILGNIVLGLFVFWILGSYFYWDLTWLKSTSEITSSDRSGRILLYAMVQTIITGGLLIGTIK